MKAVSNKVALNSFLNQIKKLCPEVNENYFIKISEDGRSNKFAIAEQLETSIKVKTDFLTYSEMNQFLRGYYYKAENVFS
jgi:hypothetical protein